MDALSSFFADYRDAVARCSQAAQGDFAKIVAMLDFSDAAAVKSTMTELLPAIVAKYGDAAATAAAELYEAVIYYEAGKRARALLAATDEEAVRVAVERALDNAPDIRKAVGYLQRRLDYYVKEPARKTVTESAKRDGVRWARVPQGSETCGWCIMLASRGFVYHSEHTAHGYHENCDCLPMPSTKADTVIDGYDRRKYEDMYLEARKRAGSGDAEAIANQIRLALYEQNKDHINEVKRQWWAANKDEQNAKRRAKAAAKR